jgi:hypothetical protein
MKTKNERKLKLYIWMSFDWLDEGLAFAIAETEEEAKELILKERKGHIVTRWGTLEVAQISKCARYITGSY